MYGRAVKRLGAAPPGVLCRHRKFLDAETTRVVRSSELEAVTGLTRYELARQFRAAFGTSRYRYSLMRGLDAARAEVRGDRSLGDVALAAGFADHAHLSRMFKSALGVIPARYHTRSEPHVASRFTPRHRPAPPPPAHGQHPQSARSRSQAAGESVRFDTRLAAASGLSPKCPRTGARW
jgi:AraC-like DNA-binding protein